MKVALAVILFALMISATPCLENSVSTYVVVSRADSMRVTLYNGRGYTFARDADVKVGDTVDVMTTIDHCDRGTIYNHIIKK